MLRTGILVDKTAALGEAHSQYINSLVKEAFEKREERKNDFIKLMSVDTKNTVNDESSKMQLKKIDGFTKRGQEIMAKSPTMFHLSVEDQVELNTMARDIQQFQEIQARTIQAYDNAKKMLAMDDGRKYDLGGSTQNMLDWTYGSKDGEIKPFNGDKAATEADFLVQAYVNIGETFQQGVKKIGLPNVFDREYEEGGKVMSQRVKRWAKDEVEMVNNAMSIIDSKNGLDRSIKKQLTDLAEGNNITPAIREAYENSYKDFMAMNGKVSEDGKTRIVMDEKKASQLAALEAFSGKPLSAYYTETKEGEEPKEAEATKARNYRIKKANPITGLVDDIRGNGEQVWAVRYAGTSPDISILSKRMVATDGAKVFGEKGGNVQAKVTHVNSNEIWMSGTTIGGEQASSMFGQYLKKIDDTALTDAEKKHDYDKNLKIYQDLATDMPIGKVVSLKKDGDYWIPIVDAGKDFSAIVPLNKDWKNDPLMKELEADAPGTIAMIEAREKENPTKKNTPKKGTPRPTAELFPNLNPIELLDAQDDWDAANKK